MKTLVASRGWLSHPVMGLLSCDIMEFEKAGRIPEREQTEKMASRRSFKNFFLHPCPQIVDSAGAEERSRGKEV